MISFTQRCPAGLPPLADDLPGWLSPLLRARGVDTPEKLRKFWSPALEDLYDPFLLDGMGQTVALLKEAIARGDTIVVYGDYDADGICAAAILTETLQEEGARVSFRIPSRHTEGYGLNEAAVREIAASARLLITVDCGVTNVDEVALAKSLGLTVIVTDHHEPPEVLPAADVVMDPLLGNYPFRRLCGAGVALKICQALQGLGGVRKRLELAAIATVADVVPLADENRLIVREGIAQIAATARPGLRALMAVAGVEPPLRSEHLAFRLAPRLNAAGRMEDASQAVTLLLTWDAAEAQSIANHLEENNRLRQEAERVITREAFRQIREERSFREDRVLIAAGEGWNPGLIGLAAGRLCEKFHFPAIVLSIQGDTAIGSCRSIPGIPIYRLLCLCDDLFLRFGGHEQAAGLTLPAARIPELRTRLNALIREHCDERCFLPVQEYDLAVPFRTWTPESLSLLDALEPTGCGNPPPLFLAANLSVQAMRRVGQDGAHLKMSLLDPDRTLIDGIAFSMGEEAEKGYTRLDALYRPTLNTFGGRIRVEAQVTALRPAPGSPKAPSPDALFSALLEELSRLPSNNTVSPAAPALSRSRALETLRRPLGTLALTRDATKAAAFSVDSGADLVAGGTPDERCFSAVWCGWSLEELRDSWQEILLLDGDIFPGEAEAIQARCPSAKLSALPPDPAWQNLPRDLALTDDALRQVYILLRKQPFRTLESLAAAASLTLPQALTALTAFAQTNLIRWTRSPFSLTLLPPVKCQMTDSPLIRYLRALP